MVVVLYFMELTVRQRNTDFKNTGFLRGTERGLNIVQQPQTPLYIG